MIIYYAHPISIYDTPQEQRDVATLEGLGEVRNPNSKEDQEGYQKKGMDHFAGVVKSCDALAFRAFPDGSIPAGVAKEIGYFDGRGPVFELPTATHERTLSVEATRQRLRCGGAR